MKTVPNSKVSFSQSEALIQIYEYLFRPLHQIFWSQDIMKLIYFVFVCKQIKINSKFIKRHENIQGVYHTLASLNNKRKFEHE